MAVATGDGAPSLRFDRLDALRGAAMVWMALFHFSFDLNHFGFVRANFYDDPLWTTQRVCILSSFLFCAGIGQAIALQRRPGRGAFWRRWAQIAGCALLVSFGSAWMFPRSWISFGVLHCIAVGLLALRFTAGWRRGLWLAGGLALALPQFVHGAVFDSRWTNWIGLVSRKPITEDFVPLLPWLGVMWWGLAAGQWLLAQRPHWLAGGLPAGVPLLGPLARFGRWGLTFYMLHQPVLIGLLALAAAASKAAVAP